MYPNYLQGYIVNAEACSRNGTSMCGVCECHEGFVGKACECYSNDDDGTGTISEDSCRQTNASAVCSDRGQCVCGQCQCKKPADPSQVRIFMETKTNCNMYI